MFLFKKSDANKCKQNNNVLFTFEFFDYNNVFCLRLYALLLLTFFCYKFSG